MMSHLRALSISVIVSLFLSRVFREFACTDVGCAEADV